MLAKIVNACLDILFPPACLICGGTGTELICKGCRSQIMPIEGPICRICGKPQDRFFTGDLCEDCFKEKPPFELARSVALYDGALKEAIHKFKFENKRSLSGELGKLLAHHLKSGEIPADEIDAIVPVPLSRRHETIRGYNQSLLLAEFVAAELNRPIDNSSLKKIKNVRPQFSLARDERLLNVVGAFSSSAVESPNILLIDDIYTTGATAREAARTLRSQARKKYLS